MGKCWTKEDVYYLLGVYHTPEKMDVIFDGSKTFVEWALARKMAPYVRSAAEEEVYGRLAEGQTLVVRGPKGDGLSMATSVALARRMLSNRAVVVDVLLRNGAAELRCIVNSIRELGMKPILYLDISRVWQYPLNPWMEIDIYMPEGLSKLAAALEAAAAVSEDGEVATVVVLSDDLYEVLRDKLGRHVAVEVSGGDADFLKKLVQAYSSCGEDVAAEVAEAVAKYDCGRAVLATLVADLLLRYGCDRRIVAWALKTAEDRTRKFVIDYVWYAVLNGNVPLILLRHFEGPMSVESAENFLISLGFPEHKVRGSLATRWIAAQHCRLIDDTIRMAVEMKWGKHKFYYTLHSAWLDYREHFKARGYLR